MAGDKQNVLSISMLDIGTLSQLKQHIEQELDFFSTSLQQLKGAQGKFQDSEGSLEQLRPSSEGKEILVPLTSSVSYLNCFCSFLFMAKQSTASHKVPEAPPPGLVQQSPVEWSC